MPISFAVVTHLSPLQRGFRGMSITSANNAVNTPPGFAVLPSRGDFHPLLWKPHHQKKEQLKIPGSGVEAGPGIGINHPAKVPDEG